MKASCRGPTTPFCGGATTLSSEGTQKEKQHLGRFVFQFLISWISLKLVLSILPEWQLFISLAGEILNNHFLFDKKDDLIYLNWVLFCAFYMPQSTKRYFDAPEVFCPVPLNQPTLPGLAHISIALCTYVVPEISKVP